MRRPTLRRRLVSACLALDRGLPVDAGDDRAGARRRVPLDGHEPIRRPARPAAAGRQHARPEDALAERAGGQQPDPDHLQRRRRPDGRLPRPGPVHADHPVHRRTRRDLGRRHRHHRLPRPDGPQRDLGHGARPREGPGARRRGVRQAPQRRAWPRHRQRARSPFRADLRVPRRGPPAGRAAWPRPHIQGIQDNPAGRVGHQALRRRTSRRSTGPPARPMSTSRRSARSTRCRSRSRSRRAIRAASCAPSTRSTTCTRARTPSILADILKDEIGFDGWVVTDFGADPLAELDAELARRRASTRSSTDRASGTRRCSRRHHRRRHHRGRRSTRRPSASCARTSPTGCSTRPCRTSPAAVVTTPEHQALAQRIAEQGSVLLKNSGTLPIVRQRADHRGHRPDGVQHADGRDQRRERLCATPRPASRARRPRHSTASRPAPRPTATRSSSTTVPIPRRRLSSPPARTSPSSSATTAKASSATARTSPSTATATP